MHVLNSILSLYLNKIITPLKKNYNISAHLNFPEIIINSNIDINI